MITWGGILDSIIINFVFMCECTSRVMRMVAYRRIGWKIKAHGESAAAVNESSSSSSLAQSLAVQAIMRQYLINLECFLSMAYNGHKTIDPKKASKYNRSYLERAWEGIVPWDKIMPEDLDELLSF